MQFLADHGVAFEERNVAEDSAYMEELLRLTNGARGTPVIVVGDEVMRGFDRGKLMRILDLQENM